MKISAVLLGGFGTAIAQSGCSSGIQALLAPLKSIHDAQSYRSSKYPVRTPTSTVTATSITTLIPTPVTLLSVTTTTVSANTTVQFVGPEIDPHAPASSSVAANNATSSVGVAKFMKRTNTTAVTTFESTTSSGKPSTQATPAKSTTTSTQIATGLANLVNQASAVVSTFCSCAENTPKAVTSTTTVTATITAPPSTINATSTYTQTNYQTITVCGTDGVCTSDCGCYLNAATHDYGCYNRREEGIYSYDCADDTYLYGDSFCEYDNLYSCIYNPLGTGDIPSGCAQRC